MITCAPSTGVSVGYVASVVILRMLPLHFPASLENVLTNTLTRGLTHSLGATLTHTLRPMRSPNITAIFVACIKFVNATLIRRRTQDLHYLERDAAYYSDFYSMFYNRNPNPRPGDWNTRAKAPAKPVTEKDKECRRECSEV